MSSSDALANETAAHINLAPLQADVTAFVQQTQQEVLSVVKRVDGLFAVSPSNLTFATVCPQAKVASDVSSCIALSYSESLKTLVSAFNVTLAHSELSPAITIGSVAPLELDTTKQTVEEAILALLATPDAGFLTSGETAA